MNTRTEYPPQATTPGYAPRPTHSDVPAGSEMRAMTALLTDGEYSDTHTAPVTYAYDRHGHRLPLA